MSVSCISIVCQQPAVAHSLSQPSFSGTLPDDVQSAPSVSSFRRQLKTFLFRQSFPDIIVYIYCAIVDFATVWVVLATLKIPDWHWHRHWHCSEWVPEFTTAVISWTLNSSIFRLLKQFAVKTEPHYRYIDRLFCWGLIQYLTNFHPKLLTSKVLLLAKSETMVNYCAKLGGGTLPFSTFRYTISAVILSLWKFFDNNKCRGLSCAVQPITTLRHFAWCLMSLPRPIASLEAVTAQTVSHGISSAPCSAIGPLSCLARLQTVNGPCSCEC